jgi:hypothetical protein
MKIMARDNVCSMVNVLLRSNRTGATVEGQFFESCVNPPQKQSWALTLS